MARSRPAQLQILCLFPVAALVFATTFVPKINAEEANPAATPVSNAREQLFQELDAEVSLLERQGNLLKKIVRLVKPSVVHIEAKWQRENRYNSDLRSSVEEAGSGVIIRIKDKDYVLTNRHVIKRAEMENIRIQLSDGRLIKPRQVWNDPGTDVAVILVTSEGLVPAKIGNSKKMEIGDFVLAVGSPFGLSHSITYGIISAKGRRDLQLGEDSVRYQDFMQTDAAINPGNSGGPLINLRGQVIGINTAIASNSGGNDGIGFTIPMNLAMVVASQLVENGQVVRAFLGVQLDSRFGPSDAASLGLPRPMGAKISGITPNSPAAGTDLKRGDVILEFDGVRIEDDSHLVNQVSLTPIGSVVSIVIHRDGSSKTLKARVGDRSKFGDR
jgi:serine protease Do